MISLIINLVLSNTLIYLVLKLYIPLIDNYVIVSVIIVFSFVYLYISTNSHSFKAINKKNILEHINRKLPEYQESSQIILDCNEGGIKRALRYKVVNQILLDEKQGTLIKTLPNTHWKISLTLLLIIFLINFYSEHLNLLFDNEVRKDELVLDIENIPVKNEENNLALIEEITIEVTPPKYTKLKKLASNDLNLNIPENSVVNWHISLSAEVDDVFMILTSTRTEKNKLKMLYNSETERYAVNRKLQQTQIYNFEVVENGINRILDGVYSIVLIKDQSPKIKIVTPKQSLVEYPLSGNHSFTLTVDVVDDFGIGNVNILASVAKGSGEAVKFRDKIFKFDEIKNNINTATKKASFRYKKQWRLTDLDMEPGDEVYFHVQATDNRQPETQTSKSSSVIVRWLDDEDIELSAEGIRIGFVPEYFRSQRQIIIETIELIEDKNDLSLDEFSEHSVDLGYSQNDLKTKYGQYLGDEFGEGPEEHFGLADGYHGDGEVDNAGTVDNHSDESEHSDEHDESGETEKIGDGEALIEKFTHNHGTEEIAPLSSRDPKTWMKMAVSEMWQAELHLMLSEPAKALPFEKKAYKYLKEARKADRIYAKRLGFEPPPVTEDRRLTGELSDLGSNFVNTKGFTNHKSSERNIRATYMLINQWKLLNDKQQESFEVGFEELKIISSLKNDLLELTKSRPVLIKYVAILEQISISKRLSLKSCKNCINDLKQRLWSLLSTPNSLPNTQTDSSGLSNQSKKQYLKTVRKLIHSSSVDSKGGNDER
ncbi:MAG: hypothetical protein COB38_04365 [Gammaproteobacteria bacterium]|nr:MAG: hypothetical protein COB38_04365 [Gammaproteobacteria bacterium]